MSVAKNILAVRSLVKSGHEVMFRKKKLHRAPEDRTSADFQGGETDSMFKIL